MASSTPKKSPAKVRVSAEDVSQGYLEDKIVAGTGITVTVDADEDGNETLVIGIDA